MPLSKDRILRVVGAAVESTVGVKVARTDKLASLLDLTDTDLSPLETLYLWPRRPLLLRVPVSACRVFPPLGFRCEKNAGNPFLDTVWSYINGSHQQYSGSALEEYYGKWAPKTADEVVGLVRPQKPSGSKTEPHGWTFPWHYGRSGDFAMDRRRIVERESVEHGADLTWKDGCLEWGPVAQKKGKMEFNRLIKTYASIAQNGYIAGGAHGYIGRSELLVRSGDWRVLIYGGRHRAAVLAALDSVTIPVLFSESSRFRRWPQWSELVQREHAEWWPRVKTGEYSKQEALQVFDRLFDGVAPWEMA